MRNIKLFVLLTTLLLFTGCAVDYNLTIDSNLNESVSINEDVNKAMPLYYEDYSVLYEFNDKVDGYKYYDRVNTNGFTKYNATYNYNDFTRVTSCSSVFDKCEFINKGQGIYIISTTKGARIFDSYANLDVININITINGEVIKNNADSVNENVYTWKLTKENAKNKSILLEFKNNKKMSGDTKKDTKETDEDEKTKNNIIYLSALIVFLVVLLIVMIIVGRNKYKK